MSLENLSNIKQLSVKDLAAKLKQEGSAGTEAGLKLARDAANYGLTVRDYLILAASKDETKGDLNGYEALLCELNLPVRNDYENGVYLQAASDTFQTYAGTRALFPEVIDDVIRFATRQDQIERVAPMLANSRTISGAELLSTVIDDDADARKTFSIPEGSRFPVRTIRTSEKTVKIFKHGGAIRHTYEFGRRASLDLMVPHANRIARELELSKVASATAILINGDGAYGAAPVTTQASFATAGGFTHTNGKLNWQGILAWLVARAKAGTPVDTIVMNWDGWFQWLLMFGNQNSTSGLTPAEALKKAGVDAGQFPNASSILTGVTPVLSSQMPADKLLGYSKGDTLEELVEAGSNVQETERAILNQTITMVRSENTGYRLVYGDTRSVYNFGA